MMKKRRKKPTTDGQNQLNPPTPTQTAPERSVSIKDVDVLDKSLTKMQTFDLLGRKPLEKKIIDK